MTTRVKAAAIAPPASLEAAQGLLEEIRALDREVLGLEHTCEDRVAAIKENAAAAAAALNDGIEMRFRALQAFVEVHRDELIAKDRESVVWPAGTVGFRKTPLAVSLAKAKLTDIARALMRRKLSHCLRVETKIDKDALKAVRERVADIDGITFSSRTEFFAKTLDAGVEHVGKVKPAKVTRARGKAKPATLRLDWRLALLALALALVALLAARAEPAAAQRIYCNGYADVIAELSKRYGELPVAIAVTSRGNLLEVLTSRGGRTWTIIVSDPNGTACVFGHGEGWRPVLPREEEGPAT